MVVPGIAMVFAFFLLSLSTFNFPIYFVHVVFLVLELT